MKNRRIHLTPDAEHLIETTTADITRNNPEGNAQNVTAAQIFAALRHGRPDPESIIPPVWCSEKAPARTNEYFDGSVVYLSN